MTKKIPPDLNIKREKIIFRGFANIPQIGDFANVSYQVAREFYEQMQAAARVDKKKTIEKIVPIERILDFFDLTESRIFYLADMERKRMKDHMIIYDTESSKCMKKDTPSVESESV